MSCRMAVDVVMFRHVQQYAEDRDADFSVSSSSDRPAIDPRFPVGEAPLHQPWYGALAAAASLRSIGRPKGTELSMGIANAARRSRPQPGRQPRELKSSDASWNASI